MIIALVKTPGTGNGYARGAFNNHSRRGALSGPWNRDSPKHTTCRGLPLSGYPTYSAFWGVFCATCLRLQRLPSGLGFLDNGAIGTQEEPAGFRRSPPTWKVLGCSGVKATINRHVREVLPTPLTVAQRVSLVRLPLADLRPIGPIPLPNDTHAVVDVIDYHPLSERVRSRSRPTEANAEVLPCHASQPDNLTKRPYSVEKLCSDPDMSRCWTACSPSFACAQASRRQQPAQ
jgi:hypothetical protein